VPAVTVIGVVRELGPVLGGLMVAGRVASAMAAELGTMRVTEQIDALVTLRTDPFRWLVGPRILAGVILAISIEPTGGSPTGAPTGPVIATGKLSAD
jgi:phospholipid/cholesterol/gamma-HCH transport system permease protein